MSDFGKFPPPGTEIIKNGKVQAGDWFFIAELGAWTLCPAIATGEWVETCGHVIARSILEEHNAG